MIAGIKTASLRINFHGYYTPTLKDFSYETE